MTQLFLILVFVVIAILAPRFIPDRKTTKVIEDPNDNYTRKRVEQIMSLRWARITARGVAAVIAILCLVNTSVIWVDSDEVGHMTRVYWGKTMPPGRIIAMPDEKGPQARVIQAGFHFMTGIKITHKIEMKPVIEVNEGHYGYLPVGTKGPQLTVLPPGKYRVNRYLFAGTEEKSTPVPAGHVAVIKSNVGDDYKGPAILPTGVEMSDLSVPIVPKGSRGVWKDVITPGEYYINKKAYDVTLVDTRVQTWKYIGGYDRRIINLVIGDDGKITQEAQTIEFPVPEDAADMAIMLRVEGWDVPQDSRVQVQVTPENAPFVVASVGGLEEVENKIITPNYRSIMRNAIAKDVTVTEPKLDETGIEMLDDDKKPIMHTVTRRRKVLDLLYQREELENIVAEQLIPAGAKAGLTVQWVRFGDPGVPPELLIPGKRRQLAKQLEATYAQEKLAQIARVQAEKERARADQQPVLMESEIGIEVANNKAEARKKEGVGEKNYYTELAIGQSKQRDVLGPQLTYELALADKLLNAAIKNPDIVKVPSVLVQGDKGGLSAAAAVLGNSNLRGMLKGNTPVVTE